MKELSLHILDIVQNSFKASARDVSVTVSEDTKTDLLSIIVQDNGCGMSADFVRRVLDPFVTTRTTRPVGLGLPLLHQAALQTDGSLDIQSVPGEGTTVTVRFGLSHFDRPPLGDLAGTLCTLLGDTDGIHFVYTHRTEKGEFVLDTEELVEILGPVSLSEPAVFSFLLEFIGENLQEIGCGY